QMAPVLHTNRIMVRSLIAFILIFSSLVLAELSVAKNPGEGRSAETEMFMRTNSALGQLRRNRKAMEEISKGLAAINSAVAVDGIENVLFLDRSELMFDSEKEHKDYIRKVLTALIKYSAQIIDSIEDGEELLDDKRLERRAWLADPTRYPMDENDRAQSLRTLNDLQIQELAFSDLPKTAEELGEQVALLHSSVFQFSSVKEVLAQVDLTRAKLKAHRLAVDTAQYVYETLIKGSSDVSPACSADLLRAGLGAVQ
ncbi:MAG: hypothetical protein AAF202_06545, partial [Pseudomonadota bacterium]